MDTSNTGDEDFLTGIGYKPHAVVKDGMIYGLGIYNMKGALVCYVHAVKALLEAGSQAGRRHHSGRGLRRNREDAVGRISGQGISRLRRGHALPGQSRRSARHVHPGRAHRHATGAGARRLHVGAFRPDRKLRAFGVRAWQGRSERHPADVRRCGRSDALDSGVAGAGAAGQDVRASSTSAVCRPDIPGAPAALPSAPTCFSTCACRPRSA